MEEDRNTEFAIWTFNGARFDLVLLIDKLLAFEDVQLKGSIGHVKYLKIGNVYFYDFYKISPRGGLAAQAKSFKLPADLMKGNFDHSKVNKNNFSSAEILGEATVYCIQDCLVLRGLVWKWFELAQNEFKIDPYVYSTSQCAVRLFTEHFCKDTIVGVPLKHYDVIRSSYYGGVCQVFRSNNITEELVGSVGAGVIQRQGIPGLDSERQLDGEDLNNNANLMIASNQVEKIYCYDFNSAYPYQLYEKYIPIEMSGTDAIACARNEVNYESWEKVKFIDYYLYFVVEIKWTEGWLYPMFGERTKKGLVYKINLNPRWIWGVELNTCFKHKAVDKVRVVKHFQFNASRVTRQFVDTLYKKKVEYTKLHGQKPTEGYDILVYFYKLMLNSFYGKTAQKLYPRKEIVSDSKLAYLCASNQEENEIDNIRSVGDNLFEVTFIGKDDEYRTQIGGCVHIASFVTAAARSDLWDAIYSLTSGTKKNLFYCDTDSIMCSEPLPAELVDEHKLGKLKLEKVARKGVFLAPKVYKLELENGDTIKRFKGIPEKVLKDQHYEDLREKGNVTINIGDILVRKGCQIVSVNITKNCKVIYKRNFDTNGYSNPL
jgi:hypothetical protein